MPLARLEVAVADETIAPFPVIVTPFDETRPAALTPPVKVEVAVEVEVIEPVVREPMEALPPVIVERIPEVKRPRVAKSEVVVAFVVVELSAINVVEAKMPFWNHVTDEVAATVVPKLVEKVNGSACPVAVLSSPQMIFPSDSVSSVLAPLQL